MVLAVLAWSPPSSVNADWMVGGFLGNAWTRTSTTVLTLPEQGTEIEIAGVEYRGESFKSPQYYGYRVSWIPDARRWMGLEAEFIHAKVFAETSRVVEARGILRGVPINASLPLSSIVERLAMSHGLNFILVNLALRRELGAADSSGSRRVVAVVRVGAGPTIPHAESTIVGVQREQYESGGLGAQAASGLELTVWQGLRLVGEYKFTWATPQIGVAGGQASVPARSHHLVGGFAYRF